jgi:hypothetical protein
VPKLEYALFEYLSTDPGISALVDTRIYPSKIPEPGIFPAIAWNRVSTNRINTYDSFDTGSEAYSFARIQFDAWDKSFEGAIAVGEALLAALSGYGGVMSGELITAHAVNEFDDHDSATKLFRRSLDFMVGYEDDVRTPGVDGLATPGTVEGSGST